MNLPIKQTHAVLLMIFVLSCGEKNNSSQDTADSGETLEYFPETPTCQKATCEGLAKNCRNVGDGCGNELFCGECQSPETCGGSGTANVCGLGTCTPKSCAEQQVTCGKTHDGCSQMIDCGTCPACSPISCATANKNCGTFADGCGSTNDCGTCTGTETCGGGGIENQCGTGTCVAKTCDELGKLCDTVSDGCSNVLNCGEIKFHVDVKSTCYPANLRIASLCGMINQHIADNGTWTHDTDTTKNGCLEMGNDSYRLQYCKKFYPGTDVVVPFATEEITNWHSAAHQVYTGKAQTYACVDFDNSYQMGIPLAPTELRAAVKTFDRVTLTWSDQSLVEDGFYLERQEIAGTTEQFNLLKNTSSYVDASITPGKSYTYQIQAYNELGKSTFSNSQTLLNVGFPEVPKNLSAVTVSTTKIQLNWLDTSLLEDGFYLNRTDKSGTANKITLPKNATTYSDDTVLPGNLYLYTIQSYNAAATSAVSNLVKAGTAISITPLSLLQTDDKNKVVDIEVKLLTPISAKLTISLNTMRPVAAQIDQPVSSKVIFEPATWQTPQTIRVSGRPSTCVQPAAYAIQFKVTSTDSDYSNIVLQDLSVAHQQLLDLTKNTIYAYVGDANSNSIAQFCVDKNNGDLTTLSSLWTGTAEDAYTLAAQPNGEAVYSYALSLQAFRLNKTTGQLSFNQAITPRTSVHSYGLVFHPTGDMVYVGESANTNQMMTIYQYSIARDTGAFSKIATITFDQKATGPVLGRNYLAIHPSGQLLYATGKDSIYQFVIDAATKVLESPAVATFLVEDFAAGGYLRVHPNGNYLYYASSNHARIKVYALDTKTHQITSEIQNFPLFNVVSLEIHPNGQFGYVINNNGDIKKMTIDPLTGLITNIQTNYILLGNQTNLDLRDMTMIQMP